MPVACSNSGSAFSSASPLKFASVPNLIVFPACAFETAGACPAAGFAGSGFAAACPDAGAVAAGCAAGAAGFDSAGFAGVLSAGLAERRPAATIHRRRQREVPPRRTSCQAGEAVGGSRT